MQRSEDFLVGPKGTKVRLSWTDDLFKARESENGKKKFGCTILIPKSTDLTAMKEAMVSVCRAEWGDKADQWIKDGIIKNPILDGDGPQGLNKKNGERHAGYAGHWFIRATTGEDYPPKLLNRKVMPITSKEELKSGDYAFAVCNAHTWFNEKNGKGVSFGLVMLQVVERGESLGGWGGANPDDFFDKIEDEGAAPAATTSGAGAAGLFG